MNIKRFRRLLEAFGADFARWPGNERAAAEQLATTSLEAARGRRQAAELDRALEEGRGHVSQDSVARVLRNVAAPLPSQRQSGWLNGYSLGPAWRPAVLFGAVAILGFIVGLAESNVDWDTNFVDHVFDSHLLGRTAL